MNAIDAELSNVEVTPEGKVRPVRRKHRVKSITITRIEGAQSEVDEEQVVESFAEADTLIRRKSVV